MSKIKRITVLSKLPRRPADAHKGSFGRVLLVGGSRTMSGAMALATNAALRGGAGLVVFAAPATVQLTIAGLCPCAVSLPLPCQADGTLSPDALAEVRDAAAKATVIAVGQGFGAGQAQRNIVQAIIEQDTPAVIDADGLNALSQMEGWPQLRRCGLILTPHPGEFARLTGKSVNEVQADREKLAVQAARAWQSAGKTDAPLVVALKGHRTVVTDGRRLYINKTGNPGMATGGTGDILTGLTAALVAQGLELFEAACLAVHCHGRAGDLAAGKYGQVSLIASDLWEFLPKAIRERMDS
jgi:NAD(P)H-hydrate epimerase